MAEEISKEEISELEKLGHVLQILVKEPGWSVYITKIKEQIDQRQKKLIEPILNEESARNHNTIVGEILGLNTAINFPNLIIAKVKTYIENEKAMKDFEKEQGE